MEAELEAALLATVARMESGDEISEEWLRDSFPRHWATVRDMFGVRPAADKLSHVTETIGGYRLLRLLGRGGMGTVFLARAESPRVVPEGTLVALKVINEGLLARPAGAARFVREARIGARLRHPNVVRTLDAGLERRGEHTLPFLVTEYVEGQTLGQLLKELGALPEELCRHLGREIARALVAIHDAGIVHRDVKPNNVLVTAAQEVKVMDLGCARLRDELVRVSQTGDFLGSVLYAAPEQFGSRKVDHRADLYNLGLVLYEMASGRHPFEGTKDSRVAMRRQIDEPPPPLDSVVPGVSPDLARLVDELLAKRRSSRPATAADVLRRLERARDVPSGRGLAERVAEAPAPKRPRRVPYDTRLLSRDAEMGQLHDAFESLGESGGRVVLVEGEAGAGKSRLVEEAVAELEGTGGPVHVLVGAFPPGGAATALAAFVEAVRDHFGDRVDEALRRALPDAPTLRAGLAALLRGEPSAPGGEPLPRESVQAGFLALVDLLACEHPTILVIEDLHFAPTEGRSLFAAMAMAAAARRVLLIGTTRPGLQEPWAAELLRREHVSRVRLGRLDAESVADLVADRLGSRAVADEIAAEVAVRAGGNPFLTLTLLRGLCRTGWLERGEGGAWRRARSGALPVPDDVHDLVAARFAGLDEPERELLDACACAGFEFDPLLVADALGLREIGALRSLARMASRDGLVRSAGERFTFDHHLVHEALVAALPEMLARRYHAALAGALERRERVHELPPESLAGAILATLCEHLLRGGEGVRALPFLEPALRHLAATWQNARALELAAMALDAPGLLRDRERAAVLLLRAERLYVAGLHDEALRLTEEAETLAHQADDLALVLRARRRQGACLTSLGRYDAVISVLERASGAEPLPGGERDFGAILGSLAGACLALGRVDAARAHAERRVQWAVAHADAVEESSAVTELALLAHASGRVDEAVALLERALSGAERTGNHLLEARVAGALGQTHLARGAPDEALRFFGRQEALSQRLGVASARSRALSNKARACEEIGRLGDAIDANERCLRLAGDAMERKTEAVAALNLAALLLVVGPLSRARTALEQAAALAAEVKTPLLTGFSLSCRGTLAELAGDPDEAERLHGQALGVFEGAGRAVQSIRCLVSLGRLAAREQAGEAARVHLGEALRRSTQLALPAPEILARTWLASLPGGDVAAAAKALATSERRLPALDRLDARFALWRAAPTGAHRDALHAELARIRAHLPNPWSADALLGVVSREASFV